MGRSVTRLQGNFTIPDSFITLCSSSHRSKSATEGLENVLQSILLVEDKKRKRARYNRVRCGTIFALSGVHRRSRVHAGLLLVNTKNRERSRGKKKEPRGWRKSLDRACIASYCFSRRSCAPPLKIYHGEAYRFSCTLVMYDAVWRFESQRQNNEEIYVVAKFYSWRINKRDSIEKEVIFPFCSNRYFFRFNGVALL